ncbi:MAG: tetratricopeptide repeat protein [Gammaproteobacteria bacterium]|nr:tetratricopeptide repeat protein [Gammaproteobacteria bacterium]
MDVLEGEYIPSEKVVRALARRQRLLVSGPEPETVRECRSVLSISLMVALLFSFLLVLYLVAQLIHTRQEYTRDMLTLIRKSPLVVSVPLVSQKPPMIIQGRKSLPPTSVNTALEDSAVDVKPRSQQSQTEKQIINTSQRPSMKIRKSSSVNQSQMIAEQVRQLIERTVNMSFDESESAFLQLYKTGRVNDSFYMALGMLYSRQNIWNKANRSFAKVCAIADANSLCLYNLAVSYDRLKNPAKAREYYLKALKAEPGRTPEFDTEKVTRRLASL